MEWILILGVLVALFLPGYLLKKQDATRQAKIRLAIGLPFVAVLWLFPEAEDAALWPSLLITAVVLSACWESARKLLAVREEA